MIAGLTSGGRFVRTLGCYPSEIPFDSTASQLLATVLTAVGSLALLPATNWLDEYICFVALGLGTDAYVQGSLSLFNIILTRGVTMLG